MSWWNPFSWGSGDEDLDPWDPDAWDDWHDGISPDVDPDADAISVYHGTRADFRGDEIRASIDARGSDPVVWVTTDRGFAEAWRNIPSLDEPHRVHEYSVDVEDAPFLVGDSFSTSMESGYAASDPSILDWRRTWEGGEIVDFPDDVDFDDDAFWSSW